MSCRVRSHFEDRIRALEGLLNVQTSTSSDVIARTALVALSSASSSVQGSTAPHAPPTVQLDVEGNSDYESGSDVDDFNEEGASGAAFALEILAGGEIVNMSAGNAVQGKVATLQSLESFSLSSILASSASDVSASVPSSNLKEIPLLNYVNGRNLIDSVLASVQTRSAYSSPSVLTICSHRDNQTGKWLRSFVDRILRRMARWSA